MKRRQILFLVLFPVVVYGQDLPVTDAKADGEPAAKVADPSAGEETAPLEPIPESMDTEMRERLASEPHDYKGMMPELKIFNEVGLYKDVRWRGPRDEKTEEEVKFSKLKVVRGRFLVSEPPPSDDKTEFRRIYIWTYDREQRVFRSWLQFSDGQQLEFRGKKEPDSRSIKWESVGDDGEKITIHVEYFDDEVTWSSEVVVDGERRAGYGGHSIRIDGLESDFPDRMPDIGRIIFGTLCCLSFPTIIVIFVVVLLVKSQAEKKRTSDLATATEQLSMQFDPLGDVDLQQRLSGLPLCKIGRGQELKNLVTGGTAEVSVSIFDFRYITGHGRSRRVRRQTVLAMESSLLQLPTFNCRPERKILDTIGGMIGRQDIDFEQHPEFSKAFVLKASDELATREFFDETLLDLFASKPDISLETLPTGFIVFRRWKRRQPEELQTLLEEGYTFFQALRDCTGRG